MAAASIDPVVPRARHAALVCMVCASAACVCLAAGGAALVMQAGLGRHATSLWMGALMLATMITVPLLMSRSSGRYAMLTSAATLIATISAMNSVPAYLNAYLSASTHRNAMAVLMIATGVGTLFYRLRANAQSRHDVKHIGPYGFCSLKAATPSGATVLLALLAGLSSGSLARFQFFAICGVSSAQPFWRIALSLGAVCALAFIADRMRGQRMLMALYVTRAALMGTLAANDNPALASLAAAIFLILDCLTIPALVNLRGNPANVLSASCPGVAHHIGMGLGAALSTTPYFFGDGFVGLYALSAMANVICAASLAARSRATQRIDLPPGPYRRQTNPSG